MLRGLGRRADEDAGRTTSPSTARPPGARATKEPRTPSTWCPPSPPANAWCWRRPRSARRLTRSSPFRPSSRASLSIEGAVVTIDAIGCQRDIAQKIIDKKADYILALKGNQGTLRNDVELFANQQKARGFADTQVSVDETGRRRPRPHRDAPRHRDPRRRLAATASTNGPGLKGLRHRRRSTREIGTTSRTRDPLLSDIVVAAGQRRSNRGARTIGRSRTACTGSWI